MARGCVPKKTLVRAANQINIVRRSREFGVHVGDIGFDWKEIIDRKRRIVLALSLHKAESLEERSIRYLKRKGRFLISSRGGRGRAARAR